jgi:hypothetical protein
LIVTALLKHWAFFYDTYSHLKRKGDPSAPALYSQPNGTMPRREPEEILHMLKNNLCKHTTVVHVIEKKTYP